MRFPKKSFSQPRLEKKYCKISNKPYEALIKLRLPGALKIFKGNAQVALFVILSHKNYNFLLAMNCLRPVTLLIISSFGPSRNYSTNLSNILRRYLNSSMFMRTKVISFPISASRLLMRFLSRALLTSSPTIIMSALLL